MTRFSLASLIIFAAVVALACGLIVSFHLFGWLYAWLLLACYLGVVAVRAKRRSFGFIASMMLVAGAFSVAPLLMVGHPVPIDRLACVRSGTTEAEVRHLLGHPSEVEESRHGSIWLYSGPTFCHVRIYFLPDSTVLRVDHDH